ncbi:hypothetical protein DVH24_012855 [Malus domestica]|uniref:Uncharacterized protein n=1 Tax=Malus domestica TaxID=3750 RepID=A0A498HVH2_MALDO|nr:hypothetical protein DVH24_012855 [Malus domestica]
MSQCFIYSEKDSGLLMHVSWVWCRSHSWLEEDAQRQNWHGCTNPKGIKQHTSQNPHGQNYRFVLGVESVSLHPNGS